MKWKRYAFPLLIIAVAGVYAVKQHDSRPAYVGKAESRLSSYLGTTHGHKTCAATAIEGVQDRWKMECRSETGELFVYDLYPPEKAPYRVADGFYLVAKNKLAIASASEGLTEYLQIDTGNSQYP